MFFFCFLHVFVVCFDDFTCCNSSIGMMMAIYDIYVVASIG